MTTFYRFLCYRLKNSVMKMIILAVMCVLIDLIVLSECVDGYVPEYNASGLYMLATLLCILASLIPVLELSGLKNRRNLDTLYFFPIGRKKMALAYYASGFVQVVAIYTVTFLVHFLYLLLNTDYFALGHMIPYYFLSLVFAFVIYSVYAFIFTQANTVADGVVMCVMWIFLLWAVGGAWHVLQRSNRSANWVNWGILYTPMNNLTIIYQDLVEINRPQQWDRSVAAIMDYLHFFPAWGVIGIAAAVGYVVTFINKGAETAGEISSSWFGYKMLIPIYGYCFLCLFGDAYTDLALIPILIYVVLMVTGYIIYRRGFKFKLTDILSIAGGIFPILFAI